MADSTNESNVPFTEAEVLAAESAEQAALSASQNAYLTRRVVVLRAQLNKLQEKVDALTFAMMAEPETVEEDAQPND